MVGKLSRFLALLATAARLVAAPPELQKPVKLLGLEEGLDREFQKLADNGVSPFISYYGVFQGNPVGGIQQRSAYSQSILFGAVFDRLPGLLLGGSLTISGAEATGKSLSGDIGNINNVSEAYVTPLTVLFYELYWKQMLLKDTLELRLGRMIAADQFATLPAFLLQVSGGINSNPTSLFVNAPFTISPNATWAASAKINATKEIYAEAAIYQASERLGKLGYHGLNFSIRANDGELILGQVGWDSYDENGDKSTVDGTPKLPGDYILGGYYSNFKFPELNGSNIQHNAYGFYAMGQQMLCGSVADTNFSVWGGLTFSPQQDISLLPFMGFAGTIWKGIVPGRGCDQLLLTYLVSDFSRNYADCVIDHGGKRPAAEHVLEASYAIWVNKYYTIQPDIQYVVRPKGAGNIRDSLVIGIQFKATFGSEPK